MAERAPQFLFDMMLGPESQKQVARQGVVDWIRRLALKPGTLITIPDPETGAEITMEYNPDNRSH